MSSTLAKIRQERLEKVKTLRKLGINPYPAKGMTERSSENSDILENFGNYENKEVVVSGRIMSFREHGGLKFAHIQDRSGSLQIIFSQEQLKGKLDKGKQTLGWDELNLLDIGDFILIAGKVVKSKTGEESVKAESVQILTKSIRPLPEKREGIKDIETVLRRRYLDMTMNPKIRGVFQKKGRFWQYMREFMEDKGFLEIRTPILEHTTGGADANPFVTHHDALDTDFYLRISLELPLKRAIGGGFEKVFEIGPVFRNEGIDDEHLQDYDMMEFYWAYANYKDSMKLVEELYKYVAEKTFGTLKFKIKGFDVDFSGSWGEIDYVSTIEETFGLNVLETDEEKIKGKLEELKVKYDKNAQKPRLVDTLWKQIRKDIKGPVFLVNQPKFISPLAKSKADKSQITERYQIIIAGSEMGNGYSELNDPVDQYDRFMEQQGMRDSGDIEAQMLDIDFVEMLEYGMPPTTGFGVSERLFSYLVDKPIRQTVMFPQMRRILENTTKEIYGINDKRTKKNKTKGDQENRTAQSFDETKEIKPGITREEALKLVKQHTKNENLVKHMLASEAAMRGYAEYFIKQGKLNKDNVGTWEIAGLVHDVMFEEDPKGHMYSGADLLKEKGVSDYITHAVKVHGNDKGEDHETQLDKALLIAESTTGLFVAATLVLPSRKLSDLTLDSLMRKFKDKRFAAKISRDMIKEGCERIGVSLEQHFQIVLDSMKTISKELGL